MAATRAPWSSAGPTVGVSITAEGVSAARAGWVVATGDAEVAVAGGPTSTGLVHLTDGFGSQQQKDDGDRGRRGCHHDCSDGEPGGPGQSWPTDGGPCDGLVVGVRNGVTAIQWLE